MLLRWRVIILLASGMNGFLLSDLPVLAQFEDQHDVKSIASALNAPIPPAFLAQARAIDDQIMSSGTVEGQKVHLVTDHNSQRVNALVRKLLKAMGEDDRQWVVRVLETQPPTINAFVYGGKYIYVYKGLLSEVGSDDELAVVLGHELGHSLLKHYLRSQQDTTNNLSGLAEVIGALAGGKKGYQDVSKVTKALRASYSRTDEEEADAIGVTIAWRAGFDPIRGADFFDRMKRRSDEEHLKVKQQLSQMKHDTEQAIGHCQQWIAAAKADPRKRNNAQAICTDAERREQHFHQTVGEIQGGLRAQQIYGDHPSDQKRIATIAALADHINGRRDLESLQAFRQSYRVMLALRQTGSVVLKSPETKLAEVKAHTLEADNSKASASSNGSTTNGRSIFNGKGNCFKCHGIDGDGQSGLTDQIAKLKPQPTYLKTAGCLRFRTDEELFDMFKDGIKDTSMVSFRNVLQDQEIRQVIAYLHELRGHQEPGGQYNKASTEGDENHRAPGDPLWVNRKRIWEESQLGQKLKENIKTLSHERQQESAPFREKLKTLQEKVKDSPSDSQAKTALEEEQSKYKAYIESVKSELKSRGKTNFEEFHGVVSHALAKLCRAQMLGDDPNASLIALIDQGGERKAGASTGNPEPSLKGDKPISEQLKQLKMALDQGLITEAEYQSKRKQIIERF